MFIHILNSLHAFFPAVPHIPMRFWLDPHLIGKPWAAMKPFQIVVLWSMVGFSYLLTLEISFSLWFFFLFFKLQCMIGSLLGFRIPSGPGVKWTAYSFSAAQETGACLTFVLFALWRARHHIKYMFKMAFHQETAITDKTNEPMPYRLTILGLIVGIVLLVFLNHLMGMSLGFALAFVLFMLVMYIALTWQIINGGTPFINPSFSPQSFFFTTLGSSGINPSTMTSLFMHSPSLTSHLREFMMPNVMNGLKAADEVKMKRQHLLIGMGIAMVLGLFISYYSVLKVCYRYQVLGGSAGFHQLNSILADTKTGTDWTNTGFIIFGSVFTSWLIWMRRAFVWWPIHPIGYTMLSSWASFKLWFSIFLGWMMKYAILKYGGLRAYRLARPIFLGLVLGEMTCAGMWAAIGMITGVRTGYRIWPD